MAPWPWDSFRIPNRARYNRIFQGDWEGLVTSPLRECHRYSNHLQEFCKFNKKPHMQLASVAEISSSLSIVAGGHRIGTPSRTSPLTRQRGMGFSRMAPWTLDPFHHVDRQLFKGLRFFCVFYQCTIRICLSYNVSKLPALAEKLPSAKFISKQTNVRDSAIPKPREPAILSRGNSPNMEVDKSW